MSETSSSDVSIPTQESDPRNRRRSQRVMLRFPVLIKIEREGAATLQAQGVTLIINAHGGLLETFLETVRDQKISLINPQSGMTVSSKVVRVENREGAASIVAFEFDRRTPEFWPISFPPEDWGVQESASR